MFKEPLETPEQNRSAQIRIHQKMDEVAKKVADPLQSDADFMNNLMDLTTLNIMAESHDHPAKG
jgi:hypothetical protein